MNPSIIVYLYNNGGAAIKLIFPVEVDEIKYGISSIIDIEVIDSANLELVLEPCNFPVSISKNAIYPILVPTTNYLNSEK